MENSERLPRKLAAILYADVAGYSRLTGADEDATHRTLSEYLDVISTMVGRHRGRIMHYAGDAVLAVFDAVADAIDCAAAICEVMPLAAKAGLEPERLAEVLTTANSRSFASEYFVPRILARQFDGDFSMQAAYKDIVNIQQIAAQFQASMPIVDAMVSTYQAAMDMGFGEQPKSAIDAHPAAQAAHGALLWRILERCSGSSPSRECGAGRGGGEFCDRLALRGRG